MSGANDTSGPGLPALRQVVLLAADLEASLAAAREYLGLNPGVREIEAMGALGFEHEVLAIDQTFIEIVSPLAADSSPGRLLARKGEGGYMVVVQVADLAAVVARAATLGLSPIMHELLDGNPISQWHPRDLGTLAELDEMRPGHDWHFCPALTDTGRAETVADLASATVAVADPAEMADRWSALLGLDPPHGHRLTLGGVELIFVAAADHDDRTGLVEVTVRPGPTPPAETVRTLAGVPFRCEPGAPA